MVLLNILFFATNLVVLTYCNAIYDTKLIPDQCLKNRVIEGDYVPRGRTINIGNLPVYEAIDNIDKTRLVIAVYDIFGFGNNNMKQVTDQVALQHGGFRTILPDFFRGDHWGIDNFPIDPDALATWLARVADWNSIIRPDLINIINYYRNQGVQEFAIFGMCWGGEIATLSAIDLYNYFKAGAMVHPAFITNEQAHYVRMPLYLMPTGDQMDMYPFYQVLRSNFGDNSGHTRFEQMFHGFAAARGNFSDPLTQMHVNEVIRIIGTFFERNLPEL